MECYNCGDRGHSYQHCPQQRHCSLCGDTGHVARFCFRHPGGSDSVTSCWNCGQRGHHRGHCPKPPRQCHGCGQYGHIRGHCRQAGRHHYSFHQAERQSDTSRRQGQHQYSFHQAERQSDTSRRQGQHQHSSHQAEHQSDTSRRQGRQAQRSRDSADARPGVSQSPQPNVKTESHKPASPAHSFGGARTKQPIRQPSSATERGDVPHLLPTGESSPAGLSQQFLDQVRAPAVECSPPCGTPQPSGIQTVQVRSLSVEQAGVPSSSRHDTAIHPQRLGSHTGSTMASSQEPEDQGSVVSDSAREFLNAWLPHLHSDVYIIPPQHIDTVHVKKKVTQGADTVYVLKTQQEIDSESTDNEEVRDTVHIDRVLKKVHYCMDKIKKKAKERSEAMVILTQAKCGLYGAGSKSLYAGAAARNTNSDETKPSDSQEPLELDKDFVDLLVIHPHHGIMMAAIIRQTGEDPHAVQEEVRKAADYLKQAEDVVRRSVLGDLATQPAVHQAILLPDTTRHCLEEALRNMDDLQELGERLGVEAGREVVDYMLCADHMASEAKLDMWWTTCLKRNEGGDPAMKRSVFEKVVASFVIPLVTVEVFLANKPRLQLWHQSHVVHAVGEEHGRPMSCIALFPQQFEVLEETPDDDNDDDDVRILHGPTGTSKTIVLILKGAQWLRKGCGTVFVLQTSDDGAAAAYLVRHQLSETVGQGAGSVQLVNMAGVRKWGVWTKGGKEKVQAWVEDLCRHAEKHGALHILADEANCDVIAEIYRALKQRGITVHLWAAGVKLEIPADMERFVRRLTEPLRCPPVVVREVEQANDMKRGTVPAYTRPPVAPPSDGPPLVTVTHYSDLYPGDTQGHEGRYPWRCYHCGQLVADILNSLRVGCHDNAPHGQGGLTYNDVFVLGGGFMDCDTDITDDDIFSPAPFIRGLESRGVPTRKVARNDTAAVRQLAEMTSAPPHTGRQREPGGAADDKVTVAHEDSVWGLERKLIIFLDTVDEGLGGYADRTGRLRSMSRATAQVIWVKNVHRQ